MSTNSDLKSFAVFLNSKSAMPRSESKSECSIPFVSNLAEHDPMKVFKIQMTNILFTNTFFNIRPNYNKLKILVLYAAGRGQPASQEIIPISIPYGFYDYDTLASYLNTVCGNNSETVQMIYSGVGTYSFRVFKGFGAIPDLNDNPYTLAPDPASVANTGSDAAVSSPGTARVLFQSPTLGILSQEDVNITTTPTTINCSSGVVRSFIYQGVYLIDDEETLGCMRTLGFKSTNQSIPRIPGTNYYGYGYSYRARTVPTAAMGNTNTIYDIVSSEGVVYLNTATDAASLFNSTDTVKIQPLQVTDLSGLDEVYIHCPQFRSQFQASVNQAKVAPNDIIAVIPVDQPFGSKISWVPPVPLTSTLVNTNITQLDFRFTNSNNELLDFQGVNWSMSLYCYEEEDTSRYQFENLGTTATPFQILQNQISGTSYLEERVARKRRNILA